MDWLPRAWDSTLWDRDSSSDSDSEDLSAQERLARRYKMLLKYEDLNQKDIQNIKDYFIPGITKSGLTKVDGEALINASIRYSAAQLAEDKVLKDYKDARFRPIQPSDVSVYIELVSKRIPFSSWNVEIDPVSLIDYWRVIYEFNFDDKCVIFFGVEDESSEQDAYPISKISFERKHTKIIDIVDVEDLYHTHHISFPTPILYRPGDSGNITFITKMPVKLNLKFKGIVCYSEKPDMSEMRSRSRRWNTWSPSSSPSSPLGEL